MTSGAKHRRSGKLRIGVSNGFSGNTWRAECMASLRKEAAKHPETAGLIIVDGQGDITKQVNDIQDLISQRVDGLLCIPNLFARTGDAGGSIRWPSLPRAGRSPGCV